MHRRYTTETAAVTIEVRIVNYLHNDRDSIRRAMLTLFLFNEEYTTEQIFKHLHDQGTSAIGLMNTLRINTTGSHNRYTLEDKYAYYGQISAGA